MRPVRRSLISSRSSGLPFGIEPSLDSKPAAGIFSFPRLADGCQDFGDIVPPTLADESLTDRLSFEGIRLFLLGLLVF